MAQHSPDDIAGIFEDWPDMALILGVIILNVAIGVIQEGKAEAAAEALNSLLAQKAVVTRGGNTLTIDAKDVVIGDVVTVQAGDSFPADLRFFQLANMRAKESALTGESVDVDKSLALCDAEATLGDRKNCAFAGTACTSGMVRAPDQVTHVRDSCVLIACVLCRAWVLSWRWAPRQR
jgi:P-type E1-E2 ATPase